jgi:multiple sugar transport system ATP-binding protein
MNELVFSRVGKRYGKGPEVLRDIDLAIGQGEFCVFIGPSGCGKSTLLRMVAGLEDITSGDLLRDGVRINDAAPSERGMAMVFQSYALYPHMTVYENMAFGLKVQRHAKADADARVREAARMLRLDGLLERLPKQLSGGQRQRVAIGRAIVRQPGIFLFDEPLSNLDAELRVQTRLEIARLHSDLGSSTMIYVTHDQVEAMTLADKIVLLNAGDAVARDGSVAQCGAPLDLYHRPANRFVAGFIGSPKMNFIDAVLEWAEERCASLRVGGPQGVPFLAEVDARGLAPGALLTLGIRPEHARLGAPPGPNVEGNVLGGVAAFVEQLGDTSYVHVRLAGGQLVTVREGGAASVQPGDALGVHCAPAALHAFQPDGLALPRTMAPAAAWRPRDAAA